MRANRRRKRAASIRVIAMGVIGVITCQMGFATDLQGERSQRYDCGAVGLCSLLNLEGVPITLEGLEPYLPPRSDRGYSMVQLRDAARSVGIHLVGVRLPKKAPRLDRPALVHLTNQGGHGHYCVIRPVGHTGKLLQILDSDAPPRVVEAPHFFESAAWSGLALVPARAGATSRSLIAGVIAMLIAGASLLAWCSSSTIRAVVDSVVTRSAALRRQK